MSTLTQQSLTEDQRVKLSTQIKLNDTFDSDSFPVLNAFSSSIVPHLTDYFILVNDLRNGLNEETRRMYFDYGFVIFPVHKSFECFLKGMLEIVFTFKVSKNSQIGPYLNYTLDQKNKKLDVMSKLPWGKKINKSKWIERWEALHQQWKINRNPITHSEQERILSLTKAEQVANAIIREMEISTKLFKEEFTDPLVEHFENQEKIKSAEGTKTS